MQIPVFLASVVHGVNSSV